GSAPPAHPRGAPVPRRLSGGLPRHRRPERSRAAEGVLSLPCDRGAGAARRGRGLLSRAPRHGGLHGRRRAHRRGAGGLRHPTGGPPRGPGRGQGAHDPLPGAHHRGSGPRAAAHRRRSARRTARPLRAHGSPSRRRGGMRINIVTIFPDFFEGPLGLSIPRRAADAGLVEYRTVDLRDYTHDIHRTVDDVPYGGGAGMVMKPEPFFEAVEDLAPAGPIVLLSARGRPFRHEDAVRLSLASELTLLCGH